MVSDMENESGETVTIAADDAPAQHHGRGEHPNSRANLASGAATQFGGENANPQYQDLELPHPESIRKSMRHLSRQPIDTNSLGRASLPLPKKATAAQRLAARVINIGLESTDDAMVLRATEYLTEQIDGKLTQVNLNAEMAALDGLSKEQLDEYDRQLTAQIAALERGASGNIADPGSIGEVEAAAGGGNAAGESGGSSTPADAPSI